MTAGLQEIGAVARELGVAPSTLRTWERRYRLVVPHRGDHGQRLYDSDQVLPLHRVLAQLRRGARSTSCSAIAEGRASASTCGSLRASSSRTPCSTARTVKRSGWRPSCFP